jgi:hypothetical protein
MPSNRNSTHNFEVKYHNFGSLNAIECKWVRFGEHASVLVNMLTGVRLGEILLRVVRQDTLPSNSPHLMHNALTPVFLVF